MFKTCDWSNERVHSISDLIHKRLETCLCVVKHYRTLVLALLLTHVITKKSYEMDCALWSKHADCIQVSAGFIILISRWPMFLLIFLNYRLNRNRAQRLFFAALHQCCTALHKSCLSTIWLFFCIFTAALLQLSVSLPQQSQKWTATANGKQLSYNLSAALVAALF